MAARRASVRLGAVGGAFALAGVMGMAPAGAAPPQHRSHGRIEVVASGLNNPRQLTYSHGALYVAEAGVGGSSSGNQGPCFIGSEGSEVCYGNTGAITRIRWGHQHRVLTRLPSLADRDGSQASGPDDIVLTGRHRFAISMGLGAPPAARDSMLPRRGQALGTVIEGRFKSRGHHGNRYWRHHHRSWRIVADVAANEARHNPDGGELDTNPVSVARQGSRYVIADAGGNDVVVANHRGRFHTLAVFPDTPASPPGAPPGVTIPMQAVPTSAIRGPDGAWYVSQLTGFPFPVGGSTIWRVVPGHAPTPYATGLTNVTDLAFARNGSLYAVEIATNGLLGPPIGSVVRIPRHGGTPRTVVGGLDAPYGIALHGCAAYVTTGSSTAGDGKVLRIRL